MNIHKAKMNSYLLNLALPPIKKLKIQNKIQLIYIQIQIYIQTNIIAPWLGDKNTRNRCYAKFS